MNEHVTTNAHKVKSYSVPQSQPPTHQTSITLTLTLTLTTIQKPQYHNTTRTLHPAADPTPNQTTLGKHPTQQSSTHTKQYHQPHKPPPTTTESLYTYTLPHTHSPPYTNSNSTPHTIANQHSIQTHVHKPTKPPNSRTRIHSHPHNVPAPIHIQNIHPHPHKSPPQPPHPPPWIRHSGSCMARNFSIFCSMSCEM